MRSPMATCRDCLECRACPCGEHGWCHAIGEFVDVGEVFPANDCGDFRPRFLYSPEAYETDDPRVDAMREEGYGR